MLCNRGPHPSPALTRSKNESKMNLKQVQDTDVHIDRWSGGNWACEVCRNSGSSSSDAYRLGPRESCRLTRTVTALSNTFALVHKVHLPKLSDALSEVKAKTEQIVRQNEEILRKLDEEKRKPSGKRNLYSNYRKRNVDLSFVSRYIKERNTRHVNQYNKLSSDAARRHRVERKKELIHKVILLLNARLYLRSRRLSRRKPGKC